MKSQWPENGEEVLEHQKQPFPRGREEGNFKDQEADRSAGLQERGGDFKGQPRHVQSSKLLCTQQHCAKHSANPSLRGDLSMVIKQRELYSPPGFTCAGMVLGSSQSPAGGS